MNHYLSLCCIIKDEDNLEDFIIYYYILGVTKFYIYDNHSKWPIKDRLNSFFYKRYCVIIDFPGKAQQMNAYNHCLNNYGHLTKWLIIVDGDEYILPKTTFTLTELLKNHEDKHAIGINWVFFGTSFHNNKQHGHLPEAYRYSSRNQDDHIKVIVQPQHTISVNNPHFAILKDNSKFRDIKNNIITRQAFNSNYTIDVIQINHYTHKSLEESINKHYRGNADSVDCRRSIPDAGLHHFANELKDECLCNKYLNLMRRISYMTATNWGIYKALNRDVVLKNETEYNNHILDHGINENRPFHLHERFPNFNRAEYRAMNPQLDDVALEIHYINSHS